MSVVERADACIHRLFEARAASRPDRVAVRAGDERVPSARPVIVTYGALDARADALARLLRARGVGPEVCVGVCVERSVDLPVALLGVLKAGGAYVPLDPEHPDERLAFLLADTDAAVVVTHGRHRDRFAGSRASVVVMEEATDAAPGPAVPDDPGRLAYVMYTSGSSGQPKGVLIEHRALSSRFPVSPYATLMGEGGVLAAITGVSWNPSIFEILYTLAKGATIALAGAAEVRDPGLLARFLVDHGVTYMRAVPTLWQALIDSGWGGKADLTIVCHGERLGAPLARRLGGLGAGVWNTYGSTEASAFGTVRIEGEGPFVPVGRVSEHLRVLTDDLREAPAGEAGEIFIGGPLLARGYLHAPDLTAARFVPDPHGQGRLFRTGDLGRALPDGTLEYIGRVDHQVKIRGQRIELGELEAALSRCAGVKDAVVLAREDTPGDVRLVAYVVGDGPAPDALRAALRRTLPAVMVPSAFVVLDALPLNANGKVDRRSLPAPGSARPALGTDAVAPATPVEEALAGLFREVLGLREVGVDDPFFELGGHSLSAVQIAARVRSRYAVDLPLAAFFESSTVRALAAEVERRLRTGERSPLPRVERVAVREGAPLSWAQERLWFLHRLAPDDVAYNLPKALRLRGPLDVGALREALLYVVVRHEALRTSFDVDADGAPRQTVREVVSLDLPVIDLARLPAEGREQAARERIVEASRRPHDLSRAPLLRASLYRLAPDDHVLLVDVHHVASDGWSNAVLRREVGAAYDARIAGAAPSLPELPFQYLDHAAWQRAHLAHGELARQLSWWKARLDGLEPLELPADRPRPKTFTHRGAREAALLPRELLDALKALAHRHDASLYMVLLAAFQVLLARYAGRTDVAVGSPVAGRNLPGTEGLIGFFVNTLVLRAEVTGRFTDLLAAVRRTALDAYAHQDLPFERLVSEINPERDLARHPVVQHVFALQNTPHEEFAFSGLDSAPFAFPDEATRLDTEVHAWETADGLLCHLVYATDLFDGWRARHMLGLFRTLLQGIVRDPDASVERLPLLSGEDRDRIVAWNATRRDFGDERCVHEVFEAVAARTPDALAVASGDGRLTYGALDARANRLANHLRGRGVGPEVVVGVGLERGPDLIVAIVAIVKAGGAWLPLDPDYPPERLAAMAAESGAALVVTRRALAGRFGGGVCVDDPDTLARESAESPGVPGDPGRLAYVISTSGSTGRPNGVAVEHRSLANAARWYADTYAVTGADRATLIASPSFDAAVLEVWPFLMAGASLHVPDADTRVVPSRLVPWLRRHAITMCFLPTPLLHLCLDEDLEGCSLRVLITGGDRLARRPRPEHRFVLDNHYGPAENTIVSTAARVGPGEGVPSIGRPVANTTAYVLDGAMQPVPVGVPGDLYVGGVGVARGYVGRPVLTAERFVPDPFGDGRLYRTGDLARWRPDGDLEFLGRRDDQVKIRGVRVELGEIDAAIGRCPGVKEAITDVRDVGPGDPRVVAYVVPAAAADASLALEYVARWRRLYDEEYAEKPVADPEFDISGWNSSFTGAPIPAHEMREWVDATVAEVARYAPERILEVGCGTGLLLYPLSRVVRAYTATDFSERAIGRIRRQLSQSPRAARIELATRSAHELDGLDPGATYDTAVVHSVVQYFPSAEYLTDVIEQVIARVSAGGRVIVGDVRNLDLREAFHRAVVRSRGDGLVPAEEIERRVQARILDDKELLLSPSYFRALAERIQRISAVEVRPRRGRGRNEMATFRVDVTLHVEAPAQRVSATARRWDAIDRAGLAEVLRATEGAVLVRGIPDDRLAPWLGLSGGVDLESLHALAAEAGRRADVRIGREAGRVDALFVPSDAKGPLVADGFGDVAGSGLLASDPLRASKAADLVPAIRARLAEALPPTLIPSAFVVIDAIPRTANGKIDRRRLPAPHAEGTAAPDARFAPTTPDQEVLAAIFAEALGRDAVGIRQDFFELGGHSLLAVQVVTRIQARLGVELPVAAVFEAPTVEALAGRVEAARGAGTRPPDVDPGDDLAAIPLTAIDVLFHYGKAFLGVDPDGWYQVMELDLPPLDLARLEDAVLYTVNRHPLARGRLCARAGFGQGIYWDVAARLTQAPLTVHEVDEAGLARHTEAVAATPLPLDEAPSVRFTLLRSARGDRLLLRYNHSAVDASGLHCLLDSLMARYLGQPDPARRVVPFTNAELLAWYDHPAHDGRNAVSWFMDNREFLHLTGLAPRRLSAARRPRWLAPSLKRPGQIRSGPVHGQGGDPSDRRCSAVEVDFAEGDDLRLAEVARRVRTTVDRLFVVGLLRGASEWNARFGDSRRLDAYWAVDLRPPAYLRTIVANQFAWSRVHAPSPGHLDAWLDEMLDPASDFLIRGALDWIQLVERFHAQRTPDALRWLGMHIVRQDMPAFLVSNTLTVNEFDRGPFADAFGVRGQRAHSRVQSTDRPVIVIRRREGRVQLRMIHPMSQFDARGAERFLTTCRDATLDMASAILAARVS